MQGLSEKLEQSSSFAIQDLRNEKARFLFGWMVHLSTTLTFGYLNIKNRKPRNFDELSNNGAESFIENKPGLFFIFLLLKIIKKKYKQRRLRKS